MVTQAKSTRGTKLLVNTVPVAELTNIGGVKLKANTIDVTSHDSPEGYPEYILGMKDSGEVGIEGNFIPGDSGQQNLINLYKSGQIASFLIQFPDDLATEWGFSGIVSSFEMMDAKVNDRAMFRASLKLSGAPVLYLDYSTGASNVVTSTGTMVPAFSSSIYDYIVSVTSGTSSLTFTVTASGTITLWSEYDNSEETLTSGQASSSKTLKSAGSITKFKISVQQASKIPRRYNISVSRAGA